jgi:hypothetical protein
VKIKFVISTHKDYQDVSLPVILNSLKASNIANKNILVVSGGWIKPRKYIEDDIEYHNVWHNSFDYTGIIDILENDLKNDYWFALHDTCEAGPNFLRLISQFDSSYDYISVDPDGFMNMGLFSWDFLQKIKKYIFCFYHCGKERAMLSEQIYSKLGKSTMFCKYLKFFGSDDVYDTGTPRNILYYEEIDLYKYQINIDDSLKICKI